MKKALLLLLAVGIMLMVSCGANLTIDNKEKAVNEVATDTKLSWDVAASIGGQDFGTIKSGETSGPKSIGSEWKIDSFSLKAIYIEYKEVKYDILTDEDAIKYYVALGYTEDAAKTMIESDEWTASKKVYEDMGDDIKGKSQTIESGNYTWYVGPGNSDGLKKAE